MPVDAERVNAADFTYNNDPGGELRRRDHDLTGENQRRRQGVSSIGLCGMSNVDGSL